MIRTMLASLAVATMLAMLADGAANAQQSGKRSGARPSHSGGVNAAMGDGSVRFNWEKSQELRSRQRTKSGSQQFLLTNELQNINGKKEGKAVRPARKLQAR